MDEQRPFDEYADQFQIVMNPFGATINFVRSPAKPGAPGTAAQNIDLGSIRMSWEHLKVMTFMMRRQVLESEANHGVRIPVSAATLNTVQIAPEDWEKFWNPGE